MVERTKTNKNSNLQKNYVIQNTQRNPNRYQNLATSFDDTRRLKKIRHNIFRVIYTSLFIIF